MIHAKNFPDELRRELKIIAIRRGMNLDDLLTIIVRGWLQRERGAPSAEPQREQH